jgi:murein DD-endopeptidase MepM/ murein hydrolase activator NlpD
MHSAAEWNRTYAQLGTTDFVAVPRYDMQKLLMPFKEVVAEKDEAAITSKLFYSTKYYGKYDLDAKEYTAAHPGIDLKLALGTPIGSLAGGRVHDVRKDAILGLHVIIEHRHPTAGTFYSIYGHLGSTSVTSGQDVQAGQIIGTVGLTGNTSGPHLHLQVDRGSPGESYHVVFLPHDVPSPGEADAHTVHPIHFIEQY